ncbi:MAG TPA: STAS domain-containing protein [Candidatus Methanoperedens sp.]|nr:STAS domain-containing protein [Candidatus Methanoperedens sp.]HLB69428.1 STAS domain-containing protein [Candidatus Methanoperedens sp.]
MEIPLLKIEDFLVVSLQTELSDREIVELREEILDKIKKTGARGLIVDITALKLIDSFMAKSLSSIADTATLLGAKTVVVGMQPAVALTLVELGLRIKWKIHTALNLERGINLLRKALRSETEAL